MVGIPLYDVNRVSVSLPPVRTLVIDVPPKIWRPKPKCSYIPADLSTEFDEDIFVFPQYGTALRQPTPIATPTRDDIRIFEPDRDMD